LQSRYRRAGAVRFGEGRISAADRILKSTVRYLGIEVDDALELAEPTEV
jgi:hypothetical protein